MLGSQFGGTLFTFTVPGLGTAFGVTSGAVVGGISGGLYALGLSSWNYRTKMGVILANYNKCVNDYNQGLKK